MTQTEQQKNAKIFAENWKDKGDEKQETQRFWIGLLGEVLGVLNPTSYIEFEKRVKRNASHSELVSESAKKMLKRVQHDKTTNFIDAYIPETKVLIEQKGIKINLDKAYEQSDGTVLTPYQQAKRYADEMPYDLRPRWIVVSNFAEIHVHDMNKTEEEPEIIFLKDLEKDFYRLEFLVDHKNENIRREVDISVAAGKLVGKMYDALVKEYLEPEQPESARSLNILCVRLVFCFYAEDAGLFGTRTSFEDYIKSFNLPNVRVGLIKLFKALDTKSADRDKYDESLKPFPYVNGGLFHDENIEIPNFTQEIVDVLVNDCAVFNWSEISPTIFGAVFESTLNPETRRKGGMHYTSIENLHKVIDPLFLDELEDEFNVIASGAKQSKKDKDAALLNFQEKLGKLKFLDPACGSGNFLTETYLSLRRLENKVISALNSGEKVLGFDEFIKVKISQFYGIEINDFAVTVAKTALWIAESQMINETEKIISQQIDFLPLKTQANIVEGNALRMNWATLTNEDGTRLEQPMLFDNLDDRHQTLDVSQARHPELVSGSVNEMLKRVQHDNHYDYIMGNPPFVGQKLQSAQQKSDLEFVFGKKHKGLKMLDYVSGWYKKSSDLIQNTNIKVALVSTNSICQGESIEDLWDSLFKAGIKIDFAYRTFRWDSESTEKAHVHCVIIGFSFGNNEPSRQKFIFTESGEKVPAKNINGYLLDAPNVVISRNGKQISGAPDMTKGAQLIDGGGFCFNSESEKNEFLKKYPEASPYVYRYYNAKDFLNNAPAKYCLYLKHCPPQLMKTCKGIYNRIQQVYEYRANSDAVTTQVLKDTPSQYFQSQVPESESIVIPVVSSENRRYIPMCFMPKGNVYTNALFYIDNATLYEFGVLTSSVHMAWMRAVCGRLKSDYRYSNDIVYNNFVFPNATDEQKNKIEQTAQSIFDARAKYPTSSLASLYDETLMPFELRKAHEANDCAVMWAYGFDAKMTEAEVVAELFRMYEELVKNQ